MSYIQSFTSMLQSGFLRISFLRDANLKFGVLAGILNSIIEAVCGLATVFVLRKYLPENLSGLWFIIGVANTMLLLPSNCIGPIVINYVVECINDPARFAPKLDTIRKLTILISLGWVLCGLSILYIVAGAVLIDNGVDLVRSCLIFFFTISGAILFLNAAVWFALLNAKGEVGIDRFGKAIVTCGGLLGVFLILYSKQDHCWLAVVFCLQGLSLWLISRRYLMAKIIGVRSESLENQFRVLNLNCGGNVVDRRQNRLEIYRLIKMFCLIMLGALLGNLVNSISVLMVERDFGVVVVSRYSPLNKISLVIVSLATVFPQIAYQRFSLLWCSGDAKNFRHTVWVSGFCAIISYVGLSLFVIMFGERVVKLWLGDSGYLGDSTLTLILLANGILVGNSVLAVPLIAAKGYIFTWASAFNLILVYVLGRLLSSWLGLIGVPVAVLLGSLLPSLWVAVVAQSHLDIFRRPKLSA